jgi:peptide deformylase
MGKAGRAGIRQIGDPVLRKRATPVEDVHTRAFRHQAGRLKDALAAFRQKHGFGRAIAAPQIGISRRFIAVDLGHGPFVMVNPEVTWTSRRKFTMYDDCMSFPALMVRIQRHDSITVRFTDERGRMRTRARLPRALSELMQHEMDHLNGVLAVDRTHRRGAIVPRHVYERNRQAYDAKVDYAIAGKPPPEKRPRAARRSKARKLRRGPKAR